MNTIMLVVFAYNLAFVCEGHASRLNVAGLALGVVYLGGRLFQMWQLRDAKR